MLFLPNFMYIFVHCNSLINLLLSRTYSFHRSRVGFPVFHRVRFASSAAITSCSLFFFSISFLPIIGHPALMAAKLLPFLRRKLIKTFYTKCSFSDILGNLSRSLLNLLQCQVNEPLCPPDNIHSFKDDV